MQRQSQDAALLQEVYHSACMGERGMEIMLEKSKDGGLSEQLDEFLEEYKEIKQEAAEQLFARGEQPEDPSAMQNTAQWMGVQLGTLTDKSPSRMAEMLIEGSAQNMIKSIEDIKRGYNTQSDTRTLAARLVSLENNSLSAMKTYLS